MSTKIGGRIKAAREAMGLNQGQLVPLLRDAGLPWSQGALSRAESGQRALKLTEALVLADVLGTSVFELAGVPQPDAYQNGYRAGRRDGIAWCIGTLTQECADAL